MKSKINLRIDAKRAQMDRKYAGDPDSPIFLPPSPLIDRRILPSLLEAELKRACVAILAKEQTSDNGFPTTNSHPAIQELRPFKDFKNSSSTFKPLKPTSPLLVPSSFRRSISKLPSKVQAQWKPARKKTSEAILFEPLEPTCSTGFTQERGVTTSENEALDEIRRKMDSRPKTSAAACIDYTETISPYSNSSVSIPSHRTTYSTPFTSAGITPDPTSKILARTIPHAVGAAEIAAQETTLPKLLNNATAFPSEARTRARTSVKRPAGEQATYHSTPPKQPSQHNYSAPPHTSDIYGRPGSTKSVRNGVHQSIRPQSSTNSLGSYGTNVSTRSRSQQRVSALKSKISRTSFRSRNSSQQRLGDDGGDKPILIPDYPNLDRPLPRLPHLDSYHQKPTHVGLMVKSILHPSTASKQGDNQAIVNDRNPDHTTRTEANNRREEDLARAVMEMMSSGGIGSIANSASSASNTNSASNDSIGSIESTDDTGSAAPGPTGMITVYRQGVRVSVTNSDATRPATAISGTSIGAVPLYGDYHGPGQIPNAKPGQKIPVTTTHGNPGNFRLVNKLSDRFGWGRRSKVVSIL